jgi:hypothetical protein
LRARTATLEAENATLKASRAALSVETTPAPSPWRSWASDHASAAVVGFIAVGALVLGLVGVLH